MTLRRAADVVEGEQLPTLEVYLTRADLVRYAGASGDFNPIHWSDRFAREVGLADVIAHGALTMALAGRLITDWSGDPGAILDYSVRFTRPVIVADDDKGALIDISGRVAEKNADCTVRLELVARCGGKTVLGRPVALVQLS